MLILNGKNSFNDSDDDDNVDTIQWERNFIIGKKKKNLHALCKRGKDVLDFSLKKTHDTIESFHCFDCVSTDFFFFFSFFVWLPISKSMLLLY